MSDTHIILVEGLKDVASLRNVGVEGEFFCVQSGGGPVKAAEHVWHSGKQAVIMTDWDRRGGTLARTLRENLSSLDVRYDDRIRGELAVLCRPYVKDVESVDAVVRLLEESCGLRRALIKVISRANNYHEPTITTSDERSLHCHRRSRRGRQVDGLQDGRRGAEDPRHPH